MNLLMRLKLDFFHLLLRLAKKTYSCFNQPTLCTFLLWSYIRLRFLIYMCIYKYIYIWKYALIHNDKGFRHSTILLFRFLMRAVGQRTIHLPPSKTTPACFKNNQEAIYFLTSRCSSQLEKKHTNTKCHKSCNLSRLFESRWGQRAFWDVTIST